MPGVALGNVSEAQCSTGSVGHGVEDRWSPGAAGLCRRLPRADAPARLLAARSEPPAGPHGAPAATDPASRRMRKRSTGASTRATSPSRPNRGENCRSRLRWWCGASPLTRRGIVGPSRNPSRAPSASSGSAPPPLDRTTSRPWFRAHRVRGEEWSVGQGRGWFRCLVGRKSGQSL